MKKKDIKVSEICKLVLLDFLCINNSNDLPQKSFPEELFYSRADKRMEERNESTPVSTWNFKGEAHLIFDDLKTKTDEAYCSMIKGMANHQEMVESVNLYEEMKQNSLKPDLTTINKLIRLISYKPEASFSTKQEEMIAKLKEIKGFGLTPNLKTFNNCLFIIKNHGFEKTSSALALDILKEMDMLKIEPCLATWAYIISIFYAGRDARNTGVLHQVIKDIERLSGKHGSIEGKDEDDSLFFGIAMEKSLFGEQSLDLFKRIHAILMSKDNIKFLNDYKFYSRYL
jgi:pentatricopeptide repeat protein